MLPKLLVHQLPRQLRQYLHVTAIRIGFAHCEQDHHANGFVAEPSETDSMEGSTGNLSIRNKNVRIRFASNAPADRAQAAALNFLCRPLSASV